MQKSLAGMGTMENCALVSVKKTHPKQEFLMVRRQESGAGGLTAATNERFPATYRQLCNIWLLPQSGDENDNSHGVAFPL